MAAAWQIAAITEIGPFNLKRIEDLCRGVPLLEDIPVSEVEASREDFEKDSEEEVPYPN